MFGNKFAGDEIAKEFQKRMASASKLKKQASQEEVAEDMSEKTAATPSPEDFLVAPVESEVVDSELTAKIDDVSNYADDECGTCGKRPCRCCKKCKKCPCNCKEDEMNEANDYYYMSNQAEYIMSELGKMAGRLRKENKAFAADMVEATAMSIKDDFVKEATKKSKVLDGLEKMAKDMHQNGDVLTADILRAALDSIKK